MHRDAVVGVVGAVVLVVAMVGVFSYERARAPGLDGEGESLGDEAGPTLEGSVQVGKSDVKVANVTATSASNVTFHLTWKATNGKDTLKLTVAPPTGSGIEEGAVSEAVDSGEVTVTVRVPPGASPEGGWQVTVEFVKATPAALPGGVPPPTPPPGSTDASVAYKVTSRLS